MTKFCGSMMTFEGSKNINGYAYSPDVFFDVIIKQPRVPVTLLFGGTPIGVTTAFSLDNIGIECEMKLDDTYEKTLAEEILYATPKFTISTDDIEDLGDTKLIKKAKLTEIGLSMHPSDTKLTTIKLINKGE